MKIQFAERYTPYLVLLFTISSINQWTSLPIGNTFIWWLLYSITLFFFYKIKVSTVISLNNEWIIKGFLFWVIVSFIHGLFKSEYYWDWKLLIGNLIVFLLPLSIYTFSNPKILLKTLRVWMKYGLLMMPFFLIFMELNAYGRYLVPVSFLLLFFPLFKVKLKFIAFLSFILIIVSSFDARSNFVKFIVPLFFSFFYYLKYVITFNTIKRISFVIALFLLVSPFALFLLASTTNFNIFKITEYYNLNTERFERESAVYDNQTYSFFADTRTFLYTEVISSAIKNEYVLFGRSMARGYDTYAFAGLYETVQKETNRNERPDSEVSILNVFNYFGFVGVCLYFIIFLVSSLTAIYKSKNIFTIVIAIYVAFRWSFAWVEDYNRFDLNYLFIWIMIAMCMSNNYLNMSNLRFKQWFSILQK